jgi:hypothetical protein
LRAIVRDAFRLKILRERRGQGGEYNGGHEEGT